MRRFPRAAILIAMAFAAPMVPAQQLGASAAGTPQNEAAATSRMGARLMYEILLGELSLANGEAPQAISYLVNAARRTGEEALFKRAVEMAIQSRSGPAALEVARAWRQAKPNSVDAIRFELQVLVALGRPLDVEAPLKTMLAMLPAADRESFLAAVPLLMQRVADKSAAAQAVEKALAAAVADPKLAPAAWTTIGRMRLQAGDSAGAFAAAALGQTAEPASEWPALLALQLFAGDEPRAEAMIQRYLAIDNAKPEVPIGYARALMDKARQADARAELDRLTARQPAYADGWLVKGALLSDQGNDSEAAAALQRYLSLSAAGTAADTPERAGERDQARIMLGRLAERRGDDAAAERWLAAVESPEQALTVQSRRATMLARQGRIDAARQAIRAVPEQKPEDQRLKLLAEAQMLRDNGQAGLAFELLSAELARDPNDDALIYDTAMAAERADKLADMERLLRQAIQAKPDSPNAYNALGYSLADRGVRLDEAKVLIEKAVQLAPDDSFIQDSLGWVLFRQGRVQEARQILEDAFRKRPDPEIAAHLGEVAWSQGDRERARQVWREGQRLDARNPTLVNTLRRLQVEL